MAPILLKKKTEEEEPSKFGLASVFKYEELEKATNSFHTQLGAGGFGRVYLGTLPDGRKVAVKVLFDRNPKRLEQFLNEVTVLSRIRHKNLISLYGCTNPRSRELLLVYDYVPNGTVADHLHGQPSDLNLALRIQIAVETAEALTYLHALDPPIIHRDVKTSNILLDNAFHVKVADLGICRLLPWDTTHVSTMPQGTLGYRDPEYDRYCRLSDKSDVYSFGVVLMELVSGQEAVDVNRNPEDIFLDGLALKKILNKKLKDFVDPKLGYHSNRDVKKVINSVAKLAHKCLHPKRRMRPSMVQVLSGLKEIQNKMVKIGQNVVDVISFSPQQDLVDGSLNNETQEILKEIQMGLNKVDVNSSDPQRELSDGNLALNNGVEVVLSLLSDLGGGGRDVNEQQKPAGDHKSKPPQASTIVLKIERRCVCEGCTEKNIRRIHKIKGVEHVIVEAEDLVIVKGTMDMKTLPTLLQKKLNRGVEVVPPKKDDRGGMGGERKTEGCGGRADEKKKEGGCGGGVDKKDDNDGGGAKKENESGGGSGADKKNDGDSVSGMGGEKKTKSDSAGGEEMKTKGGSGGDADKKEGRDGGGEERENESGGGRGADKKNDGGGGGEEEEEEGGGGGGGREEKEKEGSNGGGPDKKKEGCGGGGEEKKNEGGTDKQKEDGRAKEEGMVAATTLNKMYMPYYGLSQVHTPQIFSDENPHACSIM